MGNFRFFMCGAGILAAEIIKKHNPDHGLLWVSGNRVQVIVPAERRDREMTDYDAEIRYLRFAIINNKKKYPYESIPETPTKQQELRLSTAD